MSSTGCDLQAQLTGALHPVTEYRQSVRELLAHDVFARQEGLSRSDHIALTYERMRVVGKWAAPGTRLLADQWRYVSLMEHVAILDPALFLALGVHFGVCLGTLKNLGASAEVAATVAQLDEMDAVAVILTTELGHGTSQGASRTVARFDPHHREFLLHTPDVGARKFMANVAAPGVPKVGIVYATVMRDDQAYGIFPFVVPLRDAHGLSSGVHVLGLGDAGSTSLDHGLVSFENVRLPHGSWLRGEADFDAAGDFHDPLGDAGQRFVQSAAGVENMWVGLTAAAAATARASAAVLARYVQQRKTAGGLAPWIPVIRYRNQQEAVFGAMAASYALTFLVNKALRNHQALRAAEAAGTNQSGVVGATWTALNRDLALVKVFATKAAGRVAARCRERCGAQGLLSANRFLDYEGLAHAGNCIAGDSQLFLLDAARNIVLADDSATAACDGRPDPDATDLRDPRSLLSLGRFREQRLLSDVGEQVRRARQGGATEFEAWNEVLVLACSAMEARGQRAFLECFSEAVAAAGAPAGDVFLALQILYTVEQIEEHAGWYLSEGLLSTAGLREIPSVKHECYDRLMPWLDVLVDALDVPEDLVRAPIMADDYVNAFPAPAFLSTNHPGK